MAGFGRTGLIQCGVRIVMCVWAGAFGDGVPAKRDRGFIGDERRPKEESPTILVSRSVKKLVYLHNAAPRDSLENLHVIACNPTAFLSVAPDAIFRCSLVSWYL